MTERCRRCVLFALAVILCAKLVWKGHGTSYKTGSVAFLRYSSSLVTVRLTGDVKAGVYRFPVGSTVGTVMKMTSTDPAPHCRDSSLPGRVLRPGDIVTLTRKEQNFIDISVGSMSGRERMLVGIPLEPDKMTADDWEALPGIGPKLAQAIVADRQIYGDFGVLERVKRVPGVGEKTIRSVASFF